ncbi:MAG: hypothetical protein SYC29_11380 [Planctomycetota bacterium]|nr:hypothetical protein [Planctomycetota bacterium]
MLLFVAAAIAAGEDRPERVSDRHRLVQVAGASAPAMVYEREGRIKRLYGAVFASGASPQRSAAAFLDKNAQLFGVEAGDLRPVGPFPDGRHVQPILYDADTGGYRFTGVYYRQFVDDIPVFRSRITLLVRNEADYPLVLAASDLRNLAGFEPAPGRTRRDAGAGIASAQVIAPELVNFTDPQLVVWAGVDDLPDLPTLAHTFLGDNGYRPGDPAPEKYLFVTDAVTGEILYVENMILNADVEGNVSALASPDYRADDCVDELVLPMPYARVSIGATVAYADEFGDFVIPNDGDDPVDVTSTVRGRWFRVNNQGGEEASITLYDVIPPGPADFLHNESNSEFTTAEVNAYIQANIARDNALAANPEYPVIGNQQDWPVNVNIADTCNAYYDYSSINFFRDGGGCNNTGFGDVVHHEYGHHLVASGGSGQGAYGEGMSDVCGFLITGRSQLAIGFQSCNSGIRDADNTLQYPCDGQIHYCGQLLSGCVWDTQEELKITEPDDWYQIIRGLAINSILLHSGDSITPEITIDFLVLDDDDETIYNGTPHYEEIAAGFGAHNMDAPDLVFLGFEFPNGLPNMIAPDGGTTVRVLVNSVTGEPEPGSGLLHVDDGSGWASFEMTEVEPNVYDAVFPAVDCAAQVDFYFTAETTEGQMQYWPGDAPAETFSAISAYGLETLFADDFNEDLGWAVSGSVTDGPWERGIPITNCDRGNPQEDADGSDWCYLTDNSSADNCNSDVDGGTTILTSPIMDASAGSALISYYRWYSNTQGNDPMNDVLEVEVSDDGGSTWTPLETVGPAGPEVDGGWFYREFLIDDFVEPTDQFRIRFKASDLNDGSVVEAAVDGIELKRIDCEGGLPEDINGDGAVNTEDLLLLLGAWGPCPGCPEDINGDDEVNTADLLLLLAAWG